MSSAQKMLIHGLRSFGVDECDRQIIEFFTPLTLILGPNGTGKTTIIECLKYITTGELPPGGKKDAAFVHDPKIAGEREVKAQVRLQFTDVLGQSCTATRCVTATQRVNKVVFQSLDSVITRKLLNGEKTTLSNKCAEMDREMINLLGVSKAVLENVIFCHQEDSNWPLSEGKALKQKFDDIFASTRYVKVLDVIKKLRTEKAGVIREFHAEIKYLKQNKDKAEEIRIDKEQTEHRLTASLDTVKQIEERLIPIDKKLEKLRDKSGVIYNLKTKIEKLKSERDQMQRAQQELRDNIENEFQGSNAELKQMLKDFEKRVGDKEINLGQFETRQEKTDSDAARLGREKSKLLMELGKLEQEAQNHKETIKKRNDLVKKLADEFEMTGYRGSVTDHEVEVFLEDLSQRAASILDTAKATRGQFENKEEALQKDIDIQRKNKTKLETEQHMKLDSLKKNREEIRQINRELSRVEASGERLEDIQRELNRTEVELAEAEQAINVETLKADVISLQRQKAELDAQLKQLDSEMSRLTLESTARTQLDVFRKDKMAKEDLIRRSRARVEDTMKHIVGHMPADNLKRELDDTTYRLQKSTREASETLTRMKGQLMEKETQRSMTMDLLRKKEDELRDYERRILAVSHSQNFDEGLDRLQGELKKTQEEEGQLSGVLGLYNKYTTKLEESDPVCPLCRRGFDKQDEVDSLITEIRDRLRLVPDKREKLKTKIADKKTQVEAMLQLRPIRAAMADLSGTDIPTSQTKITTLTAAIDTLKSDITDKEEEWETLQADVHSAQQIHSDVTTVDRLQVELRDLDRKIKAQSSKLTGGDSGRSMQDVQAEREGLQIRLETVNRNLDHKRDKISRHTERLQNLRQRNNELTAEKLQIERDLQKRSRLEENKGELEANNEKLDMEIVETKSQLQPIQSRIDDLLQRKQAVTSEKESQSTRDREQFTKVKDKQKNVKTYNADIDRYMCSGKQQDLEESRDRKLELEGEIRKLEEQSHELSTKIDRLKEDLAMQKTQERELADNWSVRRKKDEIEKVTSDVGVLEEELGGLDLKNLGREQRGLEQEKEKLDGEKHTAKGRQAELVEKVRRATRELKDDMYRNAHSDHQDKLIKLKTNETANADLDKYYRALDQSIMRYHQTKMSEINQMIRELWRNTYKGNDIETIEIQSEDDDTAVASKARRTYNYRVVMKKGDAELNMRGRCSAGQKVLACLIIRLALAESFCINCGILTLDEPTTNLDRENISSLAYALVEIIKSRHRQNNFQLVVITHDEDFVELLGRSEYVEEFYKVSKNEYGCSRVDRQKVAELNLR